MMNVYLAEVVIERYDIREEKEQLKIKGSHKKVYKNCRCTSRSKSEIERIVRIEAHTADVGLAIDGGNRVICLGGPDFD